MIISLEKKYSVLRWFLLLCLSQVLLIAQHSPTKTEVEHFLKTKSQPPIIPQGETIPALLQSYCFTGHSKSLNSLSFSPDGKFLASTSWNSSIKLWDVVSGVVVKTLQGHSSYIYALSFSPDGKFLASASEDNTIKLWDVAAGFEVKTILKHSSTVYALSFSPDSKFLVSASWNSHIKLWDVISGIEVRTFPEISRLLSFSPDGKGRIK